MPWCFKRDRDLPNCWWFRLRSWYQRHNPQPLHWPYLSRYHLNLMKSFVDLFGAGWWATGAPADRGLSPGLRKNLQDHVTWKRWDWWRWSKMVMITRTISAATKTKSKSNRNCNSNNHHISLTDGGWYGELRGDAAIWLCFCHKLEMLWWTTCDIW